MVLQVVKRSGTDSLASNSVLSANGYKNLEIKIDEEINGGGIPQYVLVRVYRYLLATEDRINRYPVSVGDISLHIRMAKQMLAGMLEEVPILSERSGATATQYLEGADALAEEYLSAANEEGEIRLAIRKALSEARREL